MDHGLYDVAKNRRGAQWSMDKSGVIIVSLLDTSQIVHNGVWIRAADQVRLLE